MNLTQLILAEETQAVAYSVDIGQAPDGRNPGFFPFTSVHQRERSFVESDPPNSADRRAALCHHRPVAELTKIHVPGVLHPDLLVPMRQIAVHPSAGEPPVTVYDPSGPYADPAIITDIAQGLAPVRAVWVAARGDCAAYAPCPVQPADNGFATGERLVTSFPQQRQPLRALNGKTVT